MSEGVVRWGDRVESLAAAIIYAVIQYVCLVWWQVNLPCSCPVCLPFLQDMRLGFPITSSYEKKTSLSHYAWTKNVKTPENTRVIPSPNKPDPMMGTIQWIEENLQGV